MPPDQKRSQSLSISDLSVVLISSMLCSQSLCQRKDLLDFGRREDAANPAGMDDGKGCLDQVTLLNAAAMNKVVAQQIQELKLAARERTVFGDELVNRT